MDVLTPGRARRRPGVSAFGGCLVLAFACAVLWFVGVFLFALAWGLAR